MDQQRILAEEASVAEMLPERLNSVYSFRSVNLSRVRRALERLGHGGTLSMVNLTLSGDVTEVGIPPQAETLPFGLGVSATHQPTIR